MEHVCNRSKWEDSRRGGRTKHVVLRKAIVWWKISTGLNSTQHGLEWWDPWKHLEEHIALQDHCAVVQLCVCVCLFVLDYLCVYPDSFRDASLTSNRLKSLSTLSELCVFWTKPGCRGGSESLILGWRMKAVVRLDGSTSGNKETWQVLKCNTHNVLLVMSKLGVLKCSNTPCVRIRVPTLTCMHMNWHIKPQTPPLTVPFPSPSSDDFLRLYILINV